MIPKLAKIKFHNIKPNTLFGRVTCVLTVFRVIEFRGKRNVSVESMFYNFRNFAHFLEPDWSVRTFESKYVKLIMVKLQSSDMMLNGRTWYFQPTPDCGSLWTDYTVARQFLHHSRLIIQLHTLTVFIHMRVGTYIVHYNM